MSARRSKWLDPCATLYHTECTLRERAWHGPVGGDLGCLCAALCDTGLLINRTPRDSHQDQCVIALPVLRSASSFARLGLCIGPYHEESSPPMATCAIPSLGRAVQTWQGHLVRHVRCLAMSTASHQAGACTLPRAQIPTRPYNKLHSATSLTNNRSTELLRDAGCIYSSPLRWERECYSFAMLC